MGDPDQSLPWSGKVRVQWPPDVRCWVRPNHQSLHQVPLEVISASTSEETSATDPIPWNQPTMKLPSGSTQASSVSGPTALTPGCTSNSFFLIIPFPWTFFVFFFVELQKMSPCQQLTLAYSRTKKAPEPTVQLAPLMVKN